MTDNLILLLGTNLGEREHYLSRAKEAIEERIGKVEMASSVYETKAWGVTDQPAYLNQVLKVSTALAPDAVMKKILDIEKDLGRVRVKKWSERTIDIDILFYGKEIVVQTDLKIPHPQIQHRRFTLAPLAEIAPQLKHPVLNITVAEMLERCEDRLEVTKLKA